MHYISFPILRTYHAVRSAFRPRDGALPAAALLAVTIGAVTIGAGTIGTAKIGVAEIGAAEIGTGTTGTGAVFAGVLPHKELEKVFAREADGFDGRVGVCAQDASGIACLNGDQRFSLQSVMKLLVGIAVLDAVDRRGWKLDDAVVVRREDLSMGVQPIAKLATATPEGHRTTIGDLVRRAIVDSDSAAADILIAKLGGPSAVQAVLNRHKLRNVRLDRDERHLQTEIAGLTWRPEFVDTKALSAALAAVPKEQRAAAYQKYQKDERDTATPRGMTALLHALGAGKLLSPASTTFVLDVMTETVTFPGRLKAGLGAGWTLGHKTGTSSSWEGVTAATNDVGILTAPDGTRVAITVFIGDSKASSKDRDTLTATLSRATVASYRRK